MNFRESMLLEYFASESLKVNLKNFGPLNRTLLLSMLEIEIDQIDH